MAFEGSPETATWLAADRAEALMDVLPSGNILPEQAAERVRQVVAHYEALRPHLEEEARRRAEVLLESHQRVRRAARLTGISYSADPKLPIDVLGIYVYLPVPGTTGGAR